MTVEPLRSLRKLVLLVAFVGAIGTAVAAYLGDFEQGASFFAGVTVMWANLLILAWTWWRLLAQKTIAWTVLIIVIKYAVLLSSIFFLTRASWFHMTPAGLGIASFVIAALIWALTSREKEKK